MMQHIKKLDLVFQARKRDCFASFEDKKVWDLSSFQTRGIWPIGAKTAHQILFKALLRKPSILKHCLKHSWENTRLCTLDISRLCTQFSYRSSYSSSCACLRDPFTIDRRGLQRSFRKWFKLTDMAYWNWWWAFQELPSAGKVTQTDNIFSNYASSLESETPGFDHAKVNANIDLNKLFIEWLNFDYFTFFLCFYLFLFLCWYLCGFAADPPTPSIQSVCVCVYMWPDSGAGDVHKPRQISWIGSKVSRGQVANITIRGQGLEWEGLLLC